MARIALVHDIAGVAPVQARILRAAGHEVDEIRLPDFGATWGWLAKAITFPIRLALYVPAIVRLRREPYDVIHIHWVTRGIVGVLSGKPFLVQAHGSDLHMHVNTFAMRVLCNAVLARARTIFYVTLNLETYLRRFASKSFYLPNPIDTDALAADPTPPRRVRRAVVFVRLDPVKGVDRVFPAVERLAAMGIQLTALRWGPLTAEYLRRYEGAVRFVEPVPHAQVGSFLAGFDLVIGQMAQGALGLSELEAMAAGRPVISGIEDALYPHDRPPVVAAHTADELADRVQRMKDDSPLLEKLSGEGRAWVRRNHGFDRHRELLEEAYFGPAARVSEIPIAM